MKKLLFAAAAAGIIICSCLCFGCSSGEVEATLTYALSDDGTHYVVTGVEEKASKVTSCNIPATYSDGVSEALPVTEIGEKAFFECVNLYDITLSEGLEKIGDYAFAYCAMSEIEIPSTVTYIGTGVFGLCTALTLVTIPQSVTYLGDKAFYCCDALERVEVYGQISELKAKTFYNSVVVHAGSVYNAANLSEVVLPSSIKKIHSTALYGNPITDVYFMGTEEEWEQIVFYEYTEGDDGNYVETALSGDDLYNALNVISDDNPDGTVTVHCNYTPEG